MSTEDRISLEGNEQGLEENQLLRERFGVPEFVLTKLGKSQAQGL